MSDIYYYYKFLQVLWSFCLIKAPSYEIMLKFPFNSKLNPTVAVTLTHNSAGFFIPIGYIFVLAILHSKAWETKPTINIYDAVYCMVYSHVSRGHIRIGIAY